MMDDFSLPLFEATQSVFELIFDITDINKLSAEEFSEQNNLSVSIGVVGDLQGEIVYKFPQNTSIAMVNVMSGMEIEFVDDFVTSAISEIANIISGNVLTMLTKNDVMCDILPPVIIKEDIVKDYDYISSFCVKASIGEVCFDIRLNH